ncbi:MAG: pentapeptide repeat-containing protein [Cyanobacteria bacterium P01_F01_bin.86]
MNSSPHAKNAAILLEKYAQGERDFADIILNECVLSGAKLPYVNLKRASLKVVNLSTANLSHGDLEQAILNVSRLSGANLSHARLQSAQLNVANLIRAVLVGADLTGASLIRAELLRADLSNATLTQANLQEADLREARLRWARLHRANLSQCNLRNSSLLGADLSSAQLYSAALGGANLSGAVLTEAELRHANLRSANLSGANLRSVNLRWADLSGANLQEADLTDAKLSGANLMGAQLQGAILENTTLVHADLSRSNLQKLYCVGSDLSGATLTGALMHGANCYDLQTKDTVCEWIDLSPGGDHSQLQQFESAAAIYTFLNHRPSQVQLIVDAALNHTAHRFLAKIYEYIGNQVVAFSRPPEIEIRHRRTILTYFAQMDTMLLAIAYLATWPFQDGQALGGTLSDLINQGLERPHRFPAQDEAHEYLYDAMQRLASSNIQALRQELDDHPFFVAPLQVQLANTSGQRLQLYHNPRFGIRNLSPDDGIFPIKPDDIAMPQLDELLAFFSVVG